MNCPKCESPEKYILQYAMETTQAEMQLGKMAKGLAEPAQKKALALRKLGASLEELQFFCILNTTYVEGNVDQLGQINGNSKARGHKFECKTCGHRF